MFKSSLRAPHLRSCIWNGWRTWRTGRALRTVRLARLSHLARLAHSAHLALPRARVDFRICDACTPDCFLTWRTWYWVLPADPEKPKKKTTRMNGETYHR